MNISGHVTSVQVFENRSNLFIIHVLADEYSGSFNTDFSSITLDGESPAYASDIARFVESRHVAATLVGVDDTTGGTGSRKCERIGLHTVLE